MKRRTFTAVTLALVFTSAAADDDIPSILAQLGEDYSRGYSSDVCTETSINGTFRSIRQAVDAGDSATARVLQEDAASQFALCATFQHHPVGKVASWGRQPMANRAPFVKMPLPDWTKMIGGFLVYANYTGQQYGQPLPKRKIEVAEKLLSFAKQNGLDVSAELKKLPRKK